MSEKKIPLEIFMREIVVPLIKKSLKNQDPVARERHEKLIEWLAAEQKAQERIGWQRSYETH